MMIYRLAQNIEIQFWNMIIAVMEVEGPLMKTIRSVKRASRTKPSLIAVLILIWAAIGFVTGLIIGRVILLLQLL